MSQLSSSTNTHIFRSLSSESQKKDWSKRLSLRGIRHGAAGNSPSSGKDVSFSFCSFYSFFGYLTPLASIFLFSFSLDLFLFSLIGIEKAQIFQSFLIAETIYEYHHAAVIGFGCSWFGWLLINVTVRHAAAFDAKEIKLGGN